MFLQEIPAFGYQSILEHQLIGIGKGVFLFFKDKLIGIAAHVGNSTNRLYIAQLNAARLAMKEEKAVFINGTSGYREVLITRKARATVVHFKVYSETSGLAHGQFNIQIPLSGKCICYSFLVFLIRTNPLEVQMVGVFQQRLPHLHFDALVRFVRSKRLGKFNGLSRKRFYRGR